MKFTSNYVPRRTQGIKVFFKPFTKKQLHSGCSEAQWPGHHRPRRHPGWAGPSQRCSQLKITSRIAACKNWCLEFGLLPRRDYLQPVLDRLFWLRDTETLNTCCQENSRTDLLVTRVANAFIRARLASPKQVSEETDEKKLQSDPSRIFLKPDQS